MSELIIRTAKPEDYDGIVGVVDEWWGRPVSSALHRLFLDHFSGTSFVAEAEDGSLAGFVIGFLSPSQPHMAYVHFSGVAPGRRRGGLARELYERFFALARDDARTHVKAITSPVNSRSVGFHRAMGFSVSDPVIDYDGPSLDRVVFQRRL